MHSKGISGSDSIESYTASIQADLRKIQSRNWWSWSNTVVILLLLTSALVSFSLPSLLRDDEFTQFNPEPGGPRTCGPCAALQRLLAVGNSFGSRDFATKFRKSRRARTRSIASRCSIPSPGFTIAGLPSPRIESEVLRAQRKGLPAHTGDDRPRSV